jgi:light-regulated signal transduction histidine kinase (bacteriophytochrome)
MHATSTQQEIENLKKRLERLSEEAENELRAKLAQARQVVSDLERQLSDITGRPSASQIKAMEAKATRVRRPSIDDQELRTQILQVVTLTNQHGINAKQIATAVNQTPTRIRQFVAAHPAVLKRVGNGPGTKFFLP